MPVSEYAGADPGALAARAQQLAGHTNAAHGQELRRFVAVRAGIPPSDVAAAWLSDLDARGARLEWVGPDGTQTMTASFPRPARTATELALVLRGQLAAGPFVLDELSRVPHLEADLAQLLGDGWAARAARLRVPATQRYADRIREAATRPGGFIAHHYVRYLGDLSGGQVILSGVTRAYGPGKEPGA